MISLQHLLAPLGILRSGFISSPAALHLPFLTELTQMPFHGEQSCAQTGHPVGP
jgi:hypothetical protein